MIKNTLKAFSQKGKCPEVWVVHTEGNRIELSPDPHKEDCFLSMTITEAKQLADTIQKIVGVKP